MDGIEILQDRVSALLKRFSAVMRERDGLKKELEELRAENDDLRSRLNRAEEHTLALQIGKSMPDESAKAQARKQLDAVIGEIDKILTTLND